MATIIELPPQGVQGESFTLAVTVGQRASRSCLEDEAGTDESELYSPG